MRLSQQQQTIIRKITQEVFGEMARVWLFGSRTDDTRRGGDIDLLVETQLDDAEAVVHAQALLLAKLYATLGEQKIDVLVDWPKRQVYPPVYAIARQEGIPL